MSASPWIDCRPEHGIEAYSERSTERRQVFEDAASRLDLACLPPSVWAFLQVADLDSVKELTLMDVSWKMMFQKVGGHPGSKTPCYFGNSGRWRKTPTTLYQHRSARTRGLSPAMPHP
ncbi:hypothetical protein PMIN06_007723 [Paraphaeosphaeria minitans]